MPQIKLGDPTMSVLEIWGAEYQENDCLLLKQEDRAAFEAICVRERCNMQVRLHCHRTYGPCCCVLNVLRTPQSTCHWPSHIPCKAESSCCVFAGAW